MQQRKRAFSGFDVVVVLMVLLGVFAWFFVLNRAPQIEETFEGSRAVFYLEVSNQRRDRVDVVQINDRLLEGTQNLPIGRVIDIEIRPQEVRVDHDETQTIWWEEVEDRYVMILTIETEVRETDREVLAEGEFVIKGGSTIHFTGPGYAFSHGIILGLERSVRT